MGEVARISKWSFHFRSVAQQPTIVKPILSVGFAQEAKGVVGIVDVGAVDVS